MIIKLVHFYSIVINCGYVEEKNTKSARRTGIRSRNPCPGSRTRTESRTNRNRGGSRATKNGTGCPASGSEDPEEKDPHKKEGDQETLSRHPHKGSNNHQIHLAIKVPRHFRQDLLQARKIRIRQIQIQNS